MPKLCADLVVAVALLPLARGLGVAPAPQLAVLRHAPLPLLQAGQAVLRRAPSPLLQAGETEVDEPPLDPRGFVVPQIGDVVKVPSKWQGEYDLAQVDFVQFIESRQVYDVDVRKLKAIGGGTWRATRGGRSRAAAALAAARRPTPSIFARARQTAWSYW